MQWCGACGWRGGGPPAGGVRDAPLLHRPTDVAQEEEQDHHRHGIGFSVAGCGRLQLGVVHWATSIALQHVIGSLELFIGLLQ